MYTGSLIETTNEYALAEMAINEYINGNSSLLEAYSNGDIEYLYETVSHDEKMRRREMAVQELLRRGKIDDWHLNNNYSFTGRTKKEIENGTSKIPNMDEAQKNLNTKSLVQFKSSPSYHSKDGNNIKNNTIGYMDMYHPTIKKGKYRTIDRFGNRQTYTLKTLDSMGLSDRADQFSSNIIDKLKAQEERNKENRKIRQEELANKERTVFHKLNGEIEKLQAQIRIAGDKPVKPIRDIFSLTNSEKKEYRAQLRKQLEKSASSTSNQLKQEEPVKQAENIAKVIKPEEKKEQPAKPSEIKTEPPKQQTMSQSEKQETINKTQQQMRKILDTSEHQPKSVLARMVSSLQNLYRKWLDKKNQAKANGEDVGFFSNILRVILNCIDKLMWKIRNWSDNRKSSHYNSK